VGVDEDPGTQRIQAVDRVLPYTAQLLADVPKLERPVGDA
jgi:hypothetical protein